MKNNTKSLIHGGIILAVAVAVLVVIELTLRFVFPQNIIPLHMPASRRNIGFEFHPDYLVALKANMENTFTHDKENGGHSVRWRTNSAAFRGPELRDGAGVRVMVYGDSNVQAVFSGLEETFVYRLEQELRRRSGRDVEVVNAGVAGFGPDQSLLKFLSEADIHKPDIVIFHVYADNDFGDILRNRLFELDDSGNLAMTRHPRTEDQLLKPKGRYGQLIKNFFSDLLMARAAADLYQTLRGGRDPRKELHKYLQVMEKEYQVVKKSRPRKYSHFTDHYEYDMALLPESESAHVKRLLMEAMLRRAKEEADSRGIAFVVLIQPSVRDLSTNNVYNYRHFSLFPGYRRKNLSRSVAEILEAGGIGGLNLYDSFMRHDPDALHFKGVDSHWNGEGQRLAATELARYLMEKELLLPTP